MSTKEAGMILMEKLESSQVRESWLSRLQRPHPSVLLCTCDRTEMYSGDGEADEITLRHLFRVAGGLDSPLLGENAILGQIKNSYAQAVQDHFISPGLHRLFQHALRTGKRIRKETSLGVGAMSHAQGVMEVINQEGINLADKNVIIIGVNKLSKDLLSYLVKKGAKTLLLGNRTLERAQILAAQFGAQAFSLDHLVPTLRNGRLIITATAAPHSIITPAHWPTDGVKRTIFDLSFPRDVEIAVSQLPEVQYFGLTEVENRVDQNKENRKKAISQAERIVGEEILRYKRRFQHAPSGHQI